MHVGLRSISLHVCFMERNGRSHLTDSLKVKCLCARSLPFFLSVSRSSMLDMYFISLLCTHDIYVYTFDLIIYHLQTFRLESHLRGHLVLASPVSELAMILLQCV